MEYQNSVTEEICEAAPTSDSNKKKCVLKDNGDGCEEIEQNKANFMTGNMFIMLNLLLIVLGL